MKRLFALLALVSLVIPPALAQFDAKSLKLMPDKPMAGQQISLTYDPAGTKLATEKTVDAAAYVLGADEPVAVPIPLTRDGAVWKGTFTIPATAKALAFHLTNGDKYSDNNNEKGYATYLYKNGTIVPGSRAALGDWFGMSKYYVELDADRELARSLYDAEFKANPALKRQYTPGYVRTMSRRVAADKPLMEATATELAAYPDLTEKELAALSSLYENVGKREEATRYQQLIKTKYPNAGDALYMQYQRFGQLKDAAAKKALLDSIRTRFAGAPNLPSFDGYLTGSLAGTYVKAGKLDDARQLANNPAHAAAVMGAYNSFAWANAEKDTNLVVSAQVAKAATDWAKAQIGKSRTDLDAKVITDAVLDRQRRRSYASYADTYGFVLLKQGKAAEAIPYLNDAVTNSRYTAPEINEHYAQALVAAGNNRELLAFGKKVIGEGSATGQLEALFKTAYEKEQGANGYEAMLTSLKKEAAASQRAELMNQMVNRPAVDFTLMDLNGQPVSLASLKGKVVVLDFWATWCGPCIASFPGMQKAVTHYAQSPDVAFLFINTWQTEADKKKNAADFIARKKYPFQVLLDDKDDVVTNYKVTGIPTKYILDKNGNVRFKSIGYNGDTDKTATEIGQMIDMLRNMPEQAPTAERAGR